MGKIISVAIVAMDEEIREVRTKIKTEKKPYAVSDKLKETFASFDSDKDGKLSETEVFICEKNNQFTDSKNKKIAIGR